MISRLNKRCVKK